MSSPITTDVFKFLSVRPAQASSQETEGLGFVRDPRTSTADGRKQLTRSARALAASGAALQRWAELDLEPLAALADAHRKLIGQYFPSQQEEAATPPTADAALRQADFKPLNQKAADQRFRDAFDALYIAYLTGPDAGPRLEVPIAALRALHFSRLSADGALSAPSAVAAALYATPLIPPDILQEANVAPAAVRPKESGAVQTREADPPHMVKLIDDYVATQRLLDQVRAAAPLLKAAPQATAVSPEKPEQGAQITQRTRLSITSAPRFNEALADRLTATDKTLLKTLSIREATTVPSAALALEGHLTALTGQVRTLSDNTQFVNLLKAKDATGVLATLPPLGLDLSGDPSSSPDVDMSGRIRPLGVGDLKVVKQKLLAYEAGEVAHIENVLKGEHKDRKHRVTDRSETIIFSSEEESQETSRDTQSTDRFELKKEADQVVKEDMSVQAGITVTGGFGPVTITAHGDFAYSTSKQESTKNSSNFARDVVDRSVSRVQKRTKTERTTKTFHEVEEINDHGLDNKGGTGHVTGVYRWVDKRYRAQVYNYGRRLMLEFVVPEPAAFYRASQIKGLIAVGGLQPPPPFLRGDGQPLAATDMTPSTYLTYASRYNAGGVTPPPAEWLYITTSFDQNSIQNGQTVSKSVKDLIVPDGYALRYWNAQVSLIWTNYPQFLIQVGEWSTHLKNDPKVIHGENVLVGPSASDTDAWDDPKGPVPVSVIGYDVNAYAVNIAANCQWLTGTYEKWQLGVFEKVYAAYKAMQTEYDQKIAQAQAQAGAVIIEGRNPAMNREIEKMELKKLCITMLTGQHLNGFNAMTDPADQPAKIPEMNPIEAQAEGRYIQFFEQAFDWEQITYLFFPYFWGRKRNWVKTFNLNDPDPLFNHFLQAGAARVVLPVSPAYNEAILYFLETKGDVSKKIWQGGEAPRIDDPLFKSIAEEIKAQTDDLAGAVPEGEPWEFTVPTTLVWLQPGPELPSFT
jgi:hypothetical protein